MIQPHGNTLVDRVVTPQRAEEIRAGFDDLFTVELDWNLFFDFVNLAQGVYSPLEGFMSRNDFMKVVNDITLESGVPWPLPVVLDVDAETANDVTPGERIGITRADGTPVGVLDVDSVYRYNEEDVCTQLFGTTDNDHPGVRTVRSKAPFFIGGPIKAFPDEITRQGNQVLTPKETRVLFKKHGWETVAGPFRVTGADGPTVTELDGEPAFSVYQDVVEEHADTTVTRENFFEVAKSYPFGITRLDAEQIVRDPFDVDGDALTCFGSVPEGEFVNILTGDIDSLVSAAGDAYEAAVADSESESLYAFDCISRRLYLDDEFDRELSAIDGDEESLVGALTIGEIANDGSGHLDYYNKTAVIGAMTDR